MKSVDSYTDPKQIRVLMGNAKRQGADEIYWKAFKRLCVVSATGNDPLTRDFNGIITAYEQLLTEKNGKRTSRLLKKYPAWL